MMQETRQPDIASVIEQSDPQEREPTAMNRGFAVLAVLGLLFLGTAPSAVAGQTQHDKFKGWVGLGGGPATMSNYGDYGLLTELGFRRGPHLFAARYATMYGRDHEEISLWGSPDEDYVTDLGVLYGLGASRGPFYASVALGLAFVSRKICVGDDSGCEAERTSGIPWEAGVSYRDLGRIGVAVKAFGNENSVRSFLGLALILEVGLAG
jgi:hypothetical protein